MMSYGSPPQAPSKLPLWLLSSLLLSIVQSVLIACVPFDLNLIFFCLLSLIFLFYLLVPCLVRLRTPGDKWVALRIGLTSASLILITPGIVYSLATSRTPFMEAGGFSGLRLASDILVVLVALCMVNIIGFALGLVGSWFGGQFLRMSRLTVDTVDGEYFRRSKGSTGPVWIFSRHWLPYVLLSGALLVSVLLQLATTSFYPQGGLATLISLEAAPTYANYPYALDLPITAFSLSGMLYTSAPPDSYILHLSDGRLVQQVPGQVFAAVQGVFLTQTYIADLQGGRTVIRGYRQSSSQLLWSSAVEDAQEPKLMDGIVYLNTAQAQAPGKLLALDPATGHRIWQYGCLETQCYVSTPEVVNGIAYINVAYQTGPKLLLALQTQTGALLWQEPEYVYALPPLIAGDRLIVQTTASTLTCLQASTGHVLWQQQASFGADVSWMKVAANDHVAIITSSDTVVALRLDTGAMLWQWPNKATDLVIDQNSVYLTTAKTVVALDAVSGRQRWQLVYPVSVSTAPTLPAPQSSILGESNGLFAFRLGGFRRVAQAQVFDTTLFVSNATTGALLWQRQVGTTQSGAESIATEQPTFVGTAAMPFLFGNTIYIVTTEFVSTVPPVHFTIFEGAASLSTFFNTTTFKFTAQALNGQSGSVEWQAQHVHTYQVA